MVKTLTIHWHKHKTEMLYSSPDGPFKMPAEHQLSLTPRLEVPLQLLGHFLDRPVWGLNLIEQNISSEI